MFSIRTLLFLATLSGLVCGYDVDADLARGLINNDSKVLTEVKSNNGVYFSNYPEDCAAVYRNAKALNQHAQTGVYEIWPREGILNSVMHSILILEYYRKTIRSTV